MSAGTITSKAEAIVTLTQVRDRAGAWLLAQQRPDGALGNPEDGFHTYRAPWSFGLIGATDAAAAYCGWVRREMLTPHGTLEGPYRVHDSAWSYRNATLIVGAHQAGQYDLSLGLLPDLIAWHDPVSGGSSNDRLPDGSMGDDMDIPYACGSGFAFLACGRIDLARNAARFLETIYARQTELPDRFYYTWSRSRQELITEFDEAHAARYVVHNQRDLRQRWTIGGIAAGFLSRLYLADPQPEYLPLARQYQAFSMSATEAQFDYPAACKGSWGAALLYQITGEPEYEAWCLKMAAWYAANQQESGEFGWDSWSSPAQHIELTLEFLMHIDTLLSALASRSDA
jgi:hypothetical protein